MAQRMSRRTVVRAGLVPPLLALPAMVSAKRPKLTKHDRTSARKTFARVLETWNQGDVVAFNALDSIVVKVDDKILDESALARFMVDVAPERKRPDFKPIELEKFDRVTGSPNLQLYLASLKLHAYATESECYTEHDGSTYCPPTGWYAGFALWYVLFDGPRLVSLTHKITMY